MFFTSHIETLKTRARSTNISKLKHVQFFNIFKIVMFATLKKISLLDFIILPTHRQKQKTDFYKKISNSGTLQIDFQISCAKTFMSNNITIILLLLASKGTSIQLHIHGGSRDCF